jgi:hypothetical protein
LIWIDNNIHAFVHKTLDPPFRKLFGNQRIQIMMTRGTGSQRPRLGRAFSQHKEGCIDAYDGYESPFKANIGQKRNRLKHEGKKKTAE